MGGVAAAAGVGVKGKLCLVSEKTLKSRVDSGVTWATQAGPARLSGSDKKYYDNHSGHLDKSGFMRSIHV